MKYTILIITYLCSFNMLAAPNNEGLKEDKVHVTTWNLFANNLLKMHEHNRATHKIYTTQRVDGYSGMPRFYREVSYYDVKTKRLLSRIQWVRKKPGRMHSIELFIYNKEGKVIRDYLAAYLPHFRNAPIQTLINLHSYDGKLHSWRQFDASGARIYEQCKGKFFSRSVNITLDEDDMNPVAGSRPKVMSSDAYVACFNGISARATPYLNPLNEIKYSRGESVVADGTMQNLKLLKVTKKIHKTPRKATLYVERGDLYFELHRFGKAIADYSRAIKLNPALDKAWFGRGMAKGRAGKVKSGIKDLTVYIKRNPKSSLAYTKRGVRNIWVRQFDRAKSDLSIAIKLNPHNAEAHDDLGVVLATKKNYQQALTHFRRAVTIDPQYLKAHHNMAMVYHVVGKKRNALLAVNAALRLKQNAKNTLLLKATILESMGKLKTARRIRENAAYMTDNNWSEVMDVR